MSSNPKVNRNSLMVAVIPLACIIGSVPFCYTIQHRSGTEAQKNTSASIFQSAGDTGVTTSQSLTPYASRLRLYQTLSHLTSRAQKNGGKVTITKDELRSLSRDLRAASE
jgi:hypothetical protein